MGAPSVPPGRYFRMHMVGYFEKAAASAYYRMYSSKFASVFARIL
jgi:hypothetical protein